MLYYDILRIVLEFFADRVVQHRRGICSHASDPEPGGGYSSLAYCGREFTDLITISQMTPGPIAINSATFCGTAAWGFWGAVVSTIGCILPSCIIVSLLAYVYFKYRQLAMIQGVLGALRPAVVAMIASAGLTILILSFGGLRDFPPALSSIQWRSVAIFGIAIVL